MKLNLLSTLTLVISLAGFSACAPKNDVGDDCSAATCVAAADEITEEQVQDPSPAPVPPPKIHENPTESDVKSIDLGNLDPKNILPDIRLREALSFLRKNLHSFANRRYIVLIDYGKASRSRRFSIVDLQTGNVETYLTAHGRGSDPDFDGYATQFSDEPRSKKTSLGYFATAETYQGGHGRALRLDGLSKTNSRARNRGVVIHGASYVRDGLDPIGRSWGCPALDDQIAQSVIQKIRGGALVYAYADKSLD